MVDRTLIKKWEKIEQFVNDNKLSKEVDDKSALMILLNFKKQVRNIGMDIHYLSQHLAINFLKKEYPKEEIKDENKKSGRTGIDIESNPNKSGEQVFAAEIKTTIPCNKNKKGEPNFGSNQRDTIKKDLEKLRDKTKTKAKYKYFFVTNDDTEKLIKKSFKEYLDDPKITVINLLNQKVKK